MATEVQTRLTDPEIVAKLKERTPEELRAFQQKLKRMKDNSQAWALRFMIVRELSTRYLLGEEF